MFHLTYWSIGVQKLGSGQNRKTMFVLILYIEGQCPTHILVVV